MSDMTAMQSYGAVGTLFSIVNRTSNAVASVEWHLYRKTSDGRVVYEGQEQRTEVTRHAALNLLNKPNRFMTRQEFMEAVQQHIDLTGEGWIFLEYGSSKALGPLSMWPMRPDRVEVVESATDFIAGYIYTSPDGHKVPLGVDEVIQIRMPNPVDPYRGIGPVQSILIDLDSSRYSAEWNRNFFLNGAQPGGIITVPDGLSDAQFEEMCMRWDEQHKGVANAHRVAVIEHGTYQDVKFSQSDMQFIELRNQSRDIIREAFGISKFMLGLVDDVNRATADASEYTFAKNLTVPRCDRWKGAFNNDLLAAFGSTGKGLEFDYDSPVEEDDQANADVLMKRATAAKTLVDAGFKPKDVLVACELPEMGYEKPKPPPQLAPPGTAGQDPTQQDHQQAGDLANRVLNAQRYVAVEEMDEDTCGPCREVNGKLYKNLAAAREDYPDGTGYINCVGAKYGHPCRGHAVKRKG
jgi:HK97 family phage portal protein